MSFLRRRKPATQTPPRPISPGLQHCQLGHDLRQILIQGEGLRYLARLVAISGAIAPSYSAAGSEATAYNEGLRRMGLFILAEVQEHAPDLMPRLLLLCLPPQAPGAEPPVQ